MTSVKLRISGSKFLIELIDRVFATFLQTLVPESPEFNLDNIQPTAVFGRMVYLKPLGKHQGSCRLKRFI